MPRAAKPKPYPPKALPASVRIIAGQYRGRRLPVVGDGVRPTPDRVRETLFNWLAPSLPGSCVLDLFAGTGVLGLEALSRGAKSAVFVESDSSRCRSIQGALQTFGATGGRVVQGDSLRYLAGAPQPFDVVFVDPPFDGPEIGNLCKLLEQGRWLAEDAMLYLETRLQADLPELPANWKVHRRKTAGAVCFALALRQPAAFAQE